MVVTIVLRRSERDITGLRRMAWAMGAGSDRPEGSTIRRWKGGTSPFSRRLNRRITAVSMSPERLQHRQPLARTTVRSAPWSIRFWSRGISPNSFTATAVLAMRGSRSRALTRGGLAAAEEAAEQGDREAGLIGLLA